MNERDQTRLQDMLTAAHKACAYVDNKPREALEADGELIGFALIHAIQIIGEAASKVTLETRAELAEIEWHNIIGIRNLVVHDYLRVDYDIVWEVVSNNLPQLIAQLQDILK